VTNVFTVWCLKVPAPLRHSGSVLYRPRQWVIDRYFSDHAAAVAYLRDKGGNYVVQMPDAKPPTGA
jgi:hypothetical protein